MIGLKPVVLAFAAFVVSTRASTAQRPPITAVRPPFTIVVNNANPVDVLTVAELRRIFMKQQRLWAHGDTIVPVDWDAASQMRQVFSQVILGRSVREMAEYWVQQSVTQGLAPPSTLSSSLAVARFVATVPGAIAYLAPDTVDRSVKRVRIDGLPVFPAQNR
jgi:ABC-type phosphate transport system substrate-binding protein